MDRGAWRATVHGNARVEHDLVLSFFSVFTVLLNSWVQPSVEGAVVQYLLGKKTCALSGSMQFKSLLFRSQLDLEME